MATVDWRFPTLAEQLDQGRNEIRVDRRALIVVLDAADTGQPARRRLLAQASVSPATTLEELRSIVGDTDGDVLLLSDGFVLTEQALEGLHRALDEDSASATVCVDDSAGPRLAGVPPRAVERPRRGIVLVRRDHFLLAVDEASLSPGRRRDGNAVHDLIGEVLTCLDRPGLVHRALRSTDSPTPEPRAASGRRRPRATQILVDGRSLAYPLAGTQVHVIGLLGGLVRAGADVAVAFSGELHATTRPELGELGKAVPFVEHARVGRPEVFHRPHQFWSLRDVHEGLSIGDRLVLTQLDMVFERTPSYRRRDKYQERRETTDAAFSSADQITFPSTAAALDAASDGTLEPDRTTVVRCGVDHLKGRPVPEPASPLDGRPYLFLLGSAYWHKNRLFALHLVRWLADRHGWDGGLVLAGNHPSEGSSVEAEERFLRGTPSLAPRVVDLGHVTEMERLALLRGADLVLFPSTYEGFGFVPFEAAAVGTACVYPYRSSMRELLPDVGALPSFDLDEAGRFVAALLGSTDQRNLVVGRINAAASVLTWDRAAMGYLEVYERALLREARPVSRRLLSLVPGSERTLRNRPEVVLLDVYRRRRGFRLAADAGLRAGQVGAYGVRRIRSLWRRAP